MSRFTRLALPAGLFLATACSGDPVSGDPVGAYAAEVTGAIARSLGGPARIVLGHSGYGRPMVSLILGAEGAEDRIALVIAGSSLPAVGDYQIAPHASEPVEGAWIAAYQIAQDDEPPGSFAGMGGLVRITHSGPDRLKGVFALDAEGVMGDPRPEPLAIVIEGTFDAELAPR